ncbi:MAG: NAD-dependent epimerase/dehydratase family protein [Xanthomonadales bacterium]|nr:NAD-dependent epimerase/dehydratase family protein [Xanthomonadales bacterium]
MGTHLSRQLLARGERVRVLDLKAPTQPLAGVEYVQGSITEPQAVEAATDGCQRVYHLAALSGLWGPDKKAFLQVNRDGTRHVLAAAANASVERVVHTSTESILIAMGRGRGPQTVNEDTQCTLAEMAGEYCAGKFLAEQEARAAAEAGQDVVIVNPTVPAGPGDHWLTPPTRMMLGFLNGQYPAYLNSSINLADARDIAQGHILAADKGEVGQRYILGAHDTHLGELLEILGSLSGRQMPKRTIPYALAYTVGVVGEWLADHFTKKPPAAPLAGVKLAGIPVRFDNQKTRAALDWHPRPLRETLSDALADYQQRGLLEVAKATSA